MAGATRQNQSSVELFAIYEVSKILSSSLDLQQTLREVLRLLSYHLQMQRGRICLLTDDSTLKLIAALGMSHEEMERGQYRAGEGIVGRIVKTGMPAVVPNLADEPLFLNRTGGRHDIAEVVISLVGVPIKAAGECIGVMTIDRISDDGYTGNFDSDVRLLTMVANLIGQTVRLHRTVAEERRFMMREKFRLQKEVSKVDYQVDNVVCSSKRMQEVLAQVHRVAPFRSTVLIRGESGTGKELIARAIHMLSSRKEQPFIRINCAALPESLLESELFGHERGAFTGANRDHKGRFELATGGTLFLDEIGDISPSFQAKLLRVLQEQEFERVGGTKTIKTDVRIITATNVNLEEAVAQGKFRADLYYRINVVTIFLPPLRERSDDIPLLASHFVQKFNRDNGLNVALHDDALDILKKCPWPGNVRELENCIERAATLCRDGVIWDLDLSCQMNLCYSSTLWHHRTITPTAGAAVPSYATPPNGGAMPPMAQAAPARSSCNTVGVPGCSAANGGSCAAAPATMLPSAIPQGALPPMAQPGRLPPPMPPHSPQSPSMGNPSAQTDAFISADALNEAAVGELLGMRIGNGGPDEPEFTTPRDRLLWAMERTGWVQAKAGRLLGLTTRQVSYALRKYNIEIKRF
ncbi:regulatory protein [Skermanella stibiiresistens SB22]|uniref:Nif-specific regulatory protein n=1 Tax=Skermanella stibiiresistens SB22 TaxID=1385369 RepID=W9H3X4_9PROT|nr:nif-specific transcriptional activator NifA [Skermanella stibiiresistens]EWY39427.1 regulatory protein [Skermanella stibiiresistens SB22]